MSTREAQQRRRQEIEALAQELMADHGYTPETARAVARAAYDKLQAEAQGWDQMVQFARGFNALSA